jgi:hypothetical protein
LELSCMSYYNEKKSVILTEKFQTKTPSVMEGVNKLIIGYR